MVVEAQPKAPDVKVPDVKLPEAKVPAVKAPDVKAPDVKAPDVKAPNIKPPAVKPPGDKPAEDKSAGDKPAGGASDAKDAKDAAASNVLTDESGVVLYGEKKPTAKESVPVTLPRELAPNVKKGEKVGFRDKSSGPVTIEEIVNSPVTTASKRAEAASEAPAWVLVITAKDIRDRGYTELSQVLDDLPAMDIIRPNGEYYTRNYVRGYRSVTAEPYLIMRDGIVRNHLFYRHGQVLATFPLTDVDHIEIAYGPASAIYGTNASMGIINVITRDGAAEQTLGRTGVAIRSRLVFGGPQANLLGIWSPTKSIDASILFLERSFRFRLSTHLEDGVMDLGIGQRTAYPYTSDATYSDESVWNSDILGAYPTLTGDSYSVDRKAGVDARLYLGAGTEIAAQFFLHSTGFGTAYPADRQQTGGLWTNEELALYGRHSAQLSPSANSTTLVQFRSSGVISPTTYMTRELDDETGEPLAVVRARTSPHYAVLVTQDFDIAAPKSLLIPSDELTVGVGIRFQHVENNLGLGLRGYDDIGTIKYPINNAEPEANAFSEIDQHQLPSLGVDALGGYLMAKYKLSDIHALHLGGRLEYGSLRNKTDVVFRGGYVGNFVLHEKSNRKTGEIEKIALTAKALYGQAVYEPGVYEVTRSRYLSYDDDNGGSFDVQAEVSHTGEADLDLTVRKWLALHADGYYFYSTSPLIDTPDLVNPRSSKKGFINLTSRTLGGFDVGARIFSRPFYLWAYYSRILIAQDNADGAQLPSDFPSACSGAHSVGDVSLNKVWGGITFDKQPFSATVIGRFMGERETACTNPINSVKAYGTLDANVMLYNVPWHGVSFALRATNLLNTDYAHPGIRTADSGNTAPSTASGSYVGSLGDYNSLLPQAGRGIYMTIGFDLEPQEKEEQK